MTLHFKLAIVAVIKVVAGDVENLVSKFGDHQRWSESEEREAHALSLWVARPASNDRVVWLVSSRLTL